MIFAFNSITVLFAWMVIFLISAIPFTLTSWSSAVKKSYPFSFTQLLIPVWTHGYSFVLWIKSVAFIIVVDLFNYENWSLEEFGEGLRPASLYLEKKEMRGRVGSVLPKIPCSQQANDTARVILRPLWLQLSPLFRVTAAEKCDWPDPKAGSCLLSCSQKPPHSLTSSVFCPPRTFWCWAPEWQRQRCCHSLGRSRNQSWKGLAWHGPQLQVSSAPQQVPLHPSTPLLICRCPEKGSSHCPHWRTIPSMDSRRQGHRGLLEDRGLSDSTPDPKLRTLCFQ